MEHCIAKIIEIVALDDPDKRTLMQLGYNLGRLSEMSGLGRGPFWDLWKTAVETWDRQELEALARNLPKVCFRPPSLLAPPEPESR